MQQAKANLRQLNMMVLTAFAAVALILVYWSVVRADWLGQREDNPRLVEVELRTQRGTIYDTNNQLLAWTAGNERVQRNYAPASGAAVGYYSFRFGATGVELGYDAHLRGTDGTFWSQFVRDSRHEARIGRDVRLTIDNRWQSAADRAMADQSGAVVLVSLQDSALRVLTSYPSFDPNLLDEQFAVLSDTVGAPLLNRATQGSYQPGGVLQPFLYASALDNNLLDLNDIVDEIDAPFLFDDQTIHCVDSAELTQPTYAAALRSVCPTPITNLTPSLTVDAFTEQLGKYGFNDTPILPFPVEGAVPVPIEDLNRALIGQDSTTVSPLQVAIAWAGLAQQGERRDLRLIAALGDGNGGWVSQLNDGASTRFVERNSAEKVIDALASNRGIREHTAIALSGAGGELTAWYLALAPAHSPRYALVVVLEGSDAESARVAGRSVMRTAIGQ